MKCHESTVNRSARNKRQRRTKKGAKRRVFRAEPPEVYGKPELRYTKVSETNANIGRCKGYTAAEYHASREVRDLRARDVKRGPTHVLRHGSGWDGKGGYVPVASGPAPGPVARNMREALRLEYARREAREARLDAELDALLTEE